MATLFVAAAGSWYTIRNEGPFAYQLSSPFEPAILLQAFLAAGLFMIYTVSVVLESRHATERRLQKIVAQHTLVTENSRDVIILADFEGNRNYVSPAAKDLSGWTPQEVIQQRSTELVHPDDLPRAEALVRALRAGAQDAMLECRVQKRSGEYIWVEASLRVVRDAASGAPTGILNMVRDVTERKQAEQKLQEAYRAVETLAITDSLTGLANRRRLDQCLTSEWRRGLRDRNPLALLLIDVDMFKSYNDTYGHVRGDSCLKQIAEAALGCGGAARRPGGALRRRGVCRDPPQYRQRGRLAGGQGDLRRPAPPQAGAQRQSPRFLDHLGGVRRAWRPVWPHAINLIELADRPSTRPSATAATRHAVAAGWPQPEPYPPPSRLLKCPSPKQPELPRNPHKRVGGAELVSPAL